MCVHLPAGDYIGVKEAADIIGVNWRTVRHMIAKRELRAYQLQDRVWVIRLEEAIRARNSPSPLGRPRGS